MAEETVQQLADFMKVDVNRLMAQFKDAEVSIADVESVVTAEQKKTLLAHLRKSYSRPGDVHKGSSVKQGKIVFRAVELHKIKAFAGRFTADFSDQTRLFTVSGANGSGKSTILRSLLLVQKAFFADQFEPGTSVHAKYAKLVDDEVSRYLKSSDSSIAVTLDLNGDSLQVKLIKTDKSKRGWAVESKEKAKLQQVWNIKRPSSIVLYLDAGKSVLEEEVRYTNLNIDDTTSIDLATRCIFTPQHAFSEMYKQTIQDYVLERLVPSNPPRTTYQRTTHDIFGKLLGTIGIANFSSRVDHQVALLARRVEPTKSPTFDIRELSSGEKTLYFTLSYLFLADTVGTLIIDEPENHFHEHLLLRLVAFLGEVVSAKSLADFLVGYLPGGGAKDKDRAHDHWRKVYARHQLTQVFLLTHSKSLIYHAFAIGRNYAITQRGKLQNWSELAESNAESILREVGLSTTLSRILFVEGKGDSKVLAQTLAPHNVQVRALNGSGAVKEMFRRLSDVRNDIKAVTFGFLIDSDDKPQEFVSQLKSIDSVFFDNSFVVLDRHEIENYLLDAQLFHGVIEAERKHFNGVGGELIPEVKIEDVRREIANIAREAVETSFKKAVNAQVEMGAVSLLAPLLWGNSKLKYGDIENLQGSLNSLLGDDLHDLLKAMVVDKASELHSKYFGISDEDAIARCDGKWALGRLVGNYANHCGVKKSHFETLLLAKALEDTDGPMGGVIAKLVRIFSEPT